MPLKAAMGCSGMLMSPAAVANAYLGWIYEDEAVTWPDTEEDILNLLTAEG